MLVKSRGIVISYFPYKETSIIAKVYTEGYGLQSFIISGVRSKKTKMGAALFQPLTILDLVFYFKENTGLKRVSEIKCPIPHIDLPFDIRKSCIALFISEILNKTLTEEESDKDLFSFLLSGIIYLDKEAFNSDFHIWFLIQYSYFLGFGPESARDIIQLHHEYFNEVEGIIPLPLEKINLPSNTIRRKVLEYLLTFYANNIEKCSDIKSLKILNEVFAR